MLPFFSKIFKIFTKNTLHKKRQQERKKIYLESDTTDTLFKKRKKISFKIPSYFHKYSIYSNIQVISITGCILVVCSVCIIIFSPFFKVKTIEIIRKDDITDINIAYKALEDYRDQLIFTISSKDIAEQLKLYQKNISDVTIKTVFPNTLKITVGSYKWTFSTVINEKNYIVTTNGVLVPGKGGSDLQILKFTPQYAHMNGILDYKEVFSAKNMEKILEILNKVKHNMLSSQIKAIFYFPKEREVHMDIDTTKLMFDIDNSNDIDGQIKRLMLFIKENVDIKKPGIVYIDLRIKNKIFFCTLETEFDCKKNLQYFYQYK
jgi:cell division septal protein FtsQ